MAGRFIWQADVQFRLRPVLLPAVCLWLCLFLLPLKALAENREASALKTVFGLLHQRLELMEGVAAYKFSYGIPVENTAREDIVLGRARSKAQELGLNEAAVEDAFRMQIELAKTVQSGWIDYWQTRGQAPTGEEPTAHLETVIRPTLIRLGEQLIEHIPYALSALHDHARFDDNLRQLNQSLSNRFISRQRKSDLLHALIQIQRQADRSPEPLITVLNRGVLRVGTTGDYQPFSFINPATHNYDGIDIDLASQLAEHLGVKLHLVKTSWPNLMADLAANTFDIGMSGISRTDARQRVAFFSDPYFSGGKTPIALCTRADTFNTLANIDQPGVRVIVNPGGTNEKFVRSKIKNAQIIVHPDNTTIFEQLSKGRADVMITDAIEVKLQQRLHPELCATMPGQLLTRADKAFLMPENHALKEAVDSWLSQLKFSGRVEAVFVRYLD